MKQLRNLSIDLIKFFAAILITNSHMVDLYPVKYSHFATGGSIGDALFFFCSGFLMMMGKNSDFFNWYKRRINRIFPTVFAVAILSMLFLGKNPTLMHILLHGGGWFVQAILVFYALLWFIKRYLFNRIWIVYVLISVVTIVWFVVFWDKSVSIFEHDTYFRWPCFFLIMMMGASIYQRQQKISEESCEKPLWGHIVVLIVLIGFFYGFQIMRGRYSFLNHYQVILIPILMGIVLQVFHICSKEVVLKVYKKPFIYYPVYYISACCLEIYLCGRWCFGIGRYLINFFPLNILAAFILIIIVSYVVKVFSNFLSQTFKTEKYDWREMVVL